MGEQSGDDAAGTASGQHRFCHGADIHEVTAAAAHLLGVTDAEQPELGGLLVKSLGNLARAFPIPKIRCDLFCGEGADRLSEGQTFGGEER